MANGEKLLSLESLRGIAAVSVAIFHFGVNSHFDNAFIRQSWLMVDFFFVLSGFVIAMNYQHRLGNFEQLLSFQQRRFFRLYPLHVFMLLVFLGIEVSKWLAESFMGLQGSSPSFSKNDLYSFLSHLALLQNFTHDQITWNEPSWSISAEFYTYILFALVMLLVRSNILRLLLASILIVMIAGSLLISKGMVTDSVSGPLRCFYSFFLGVIAYNGYQFCLDRWGRMSSSLLAFAMFVASILVIAFSKGEEHVSTLFIPLLFVITIVTLSLTSSDTTFIRYMERPFLVMLGTLSYGIYMVHQAVWWCVNQVFLVLLKFPVAANHHGEMKLYFENIWLADMTLLFGLSIIMLLAYLSHRYIEMPGQALGQKLYRRRQHTKRERDMLHSVAN